MESNRFKEAVEAIAVLKELGLPISIEQLRERRILENKYLSETLVPQIQEYIQNLVEDVHKSFSLIVDYNYGSPVKVQIVGHYSSPQTENNDSLQKKGKTENAYNALLAKELWDKFSASLPSGNIVLKATFSQKFKSISQLLRLLRDKDLEKYTLPLLEDLQVPSDGKLTPKLIIDLLEPEQFISTSKTDLTQKTIGLWSQTQKVDKLEDGTRVKVFAEDGVTPIMVKKIKPIKEGQWTLKILCELIAQKRYFEELRVSKII